MPKIISVHSFRGGTGKSNTTANLTALLAASGYRVGVIDTDIQSPGIHVIFGLDETQITRALNDVIWGECEIEDAVYDVTPLLGVPVSGRVLFVPASAKLNEIARVLRDGYDPGMLNESFQRLIASFDLDVLLIDTHPGLNEETLLSIAVSDVLLVLMRPDSQDYQGTGVTVEVARQLEVPRIVLLVNKVPHTFNQEQVRQRVEAIYDAPVAAVIPHSDDLMSLASDGIFALRFPEHQLTDLYRQLILSLIR